jgi:hypothetical protein
MGSSVVLRPEKVVSMTTVKDCIFRKLNRRMKRVFPSSCDLDRWRNQSFMKMPLRGRALMILSHISEAFNLHLQQHSLIVAMSMHGTCNICRSSSQEDL